jgi:hypothetical protein
MRYGHVLVFFGVCIVCARTPTLKGAVCPVSLLLA